MSAHQPIDIRLTLGPVEAAVDRRGGGLRALTVSGTAIVESYDAGGPIPGAAGAVLFPWPNRVRDARWTWRGVHHRLDMTEPERGNALHGLVRRRLFDVRERAAHEVELHTLLEPSPGYPFCIDVSVHYCLTESGIEVACRVANAGADPAPFALGFHPYVRVGDAPLESLRLEIPAVRGYELDDRLVPVRSHDIGDAPRDPRGAMPALVPFNDCFAVEPDADGRTRARLVAPDGRGVELAADADFGWIHVYTAREEMTSDAPAPLAIAIEPMTAPPDAFNSREGLVVVQPDEEWSARWGLRLRADHSWPVP